MLSRSAWNGELRRVDDQIGLARSGSSIGALGGDPFGQRLVALQRMAAAVLLVPADQDVVGGLEEQHPRA